MYQDILPYSYNGTFAILDPQPTDSILVYKRGQVLACVKDGSIVYPTYADVAAAQSAVSSQAESSELNQAETPAPASKIGAPFVYLFKVGEQRYFLGDCSDEAVAALENAGFTYEMVGMLRDKGEKEKVFAGIVGMHFFDWYSTRQYCGRCGTRMIADTNERMMKCPECGLMEFPKLFPVVIVAVTNGDKVLVSQYPHSPADRFALIAGFAEPGETIEETVAREVMEEVGLKVKNLKYYKSQPWAFSSSLLFGFFCELDGSDEITLDKNELAWAGWKTREELPVRDIDAEYSLTADMMRLIKNGEDAQYR